MPFPTIASPFSLPLPLSSDFNTGNMPNREGDMKEDQLVTQLGIEGTFSLN